MRAKTFIAASPDSQGQLTLDNRPPLEQSTLPVILTDLTPYHLRTLETLHHVYGTHSATQRICRSVSCGQLISNTKPDTPIEAYDKNFFTQMNTLPTPLPFAADHCAAIIPLSNDTSSSVVMYDIVDAIRHTTLLNTSSAGESYFQPPTTQDIQKYMSDVSPTHYNPTVGIAAGWKNSVSQALSHGQGWNFLTFPPADGTNNKRHLLFERAYNGSYIVGSGQCRTLNKNKLKQPNSPSRKSISSPSPSPPAATSEQAPSTPSVLSSRSSTSNESA
jgi:hypothetical protein